MIKFQTKSALSLIVLAAMAIAFTACNSSDEANNANPETTDEDPNFAVSSLTSGDAGLLESATPEFKWDAVDGADAYQLILTEAEGNRITYNLSLIHI